MPCIETDLKRDNARKQNAQQLFCSFFFGGGGVRGLEAGVEKVRASLKFRIMKKKCQKLSKIQKFQKISKNHFPNFFFGKKKKSKKKKFYPLSFAN